MFIAQHLDLLFEDGDYFLENTETNLFPLRDKGADQCFVNLERDNAVEFSSYLTINQLFDIADSYN